MARQVCTLCRWALSVAAVLAFAHSMVLPGVAGAETVAVPPFDRGVVGSRAAGAKVLGTADLAGIRAWLEAHRAGWRVNLATTPIAEVAMSLGTVAQPSAVTLDLWPTAPDASWRSTVVMEDVAAQSTWVQTLSAQDAATLLGLVR